MKAIVVCPAHAGIDLLDPVFAHSYIDANKGCWRKC